MKTPISHFRTGAPTTATIAPPRLPSAFNPSAPRRADHAMRQIFRSAHEEDSPTLKKLLSLSHPEQDAMLTEIEAAMHAGKPSIEFHAAGVHVVVDLKNHKLSINDEPSGTIREALGVIRDDLWRTRIDRANASEAAERGGYRLNSAVPVTDEEIPEMVDRLFGSRSEAERARLRRAFQEVSDGDRESFSAKSDAGQVIESTSNLTNADRARRDLNRMMDEPLTMQRVNESAAYKITEAFREKKMIFPTMLDDEAPPTEEQSLDLSVFQIFLIQHDWAAAFARSDQFEGGEWKPPAMACAFETRLCGRRVVVGMVEDEEQGEGCYLVFFMVETPAGWCVLSPYQWAGSGGLVAWKSDASNPTGFRKFADFMFGQIRAICIALDAEVASTEVIRAPHKLNREREKKGRLPLLDFHIVNLAKRKRYALPDDHEPTPGRKKRLHFVRGHWRHFEAHKTWIKWHLRGDPDLGFIDKEYRL